MRYDGGEMTRRPVEITQTYTPGKNQGRTRQVTVHRIPATEVTYNGVAEPHLSFDVVERVHALVNEALRSNDSQQQTLIYTEIGVPASRTR
jgi:hypothetical protein